MCYIHLALVFCGFTILFDEFGYSIETDCLR